MNPAWLDRDAELEQWPMEESAALIANSSGSEGSGASTDVGFVLNQKTAPPVPGSGGGVALRNRAYSGGQSSCAC